MTAVQYLVQQLSKILGKLNTNAMQDLLIIDAMKEAKKMHKQQTVDAYMSGFNDGKGLVMDKIKYNLNDIPDSLYCAELWYNKKY